MAHEIYKGKFVSYRQPAWHGLGLVVPDAIGAAEAARRIAIPTVETGTVYLKAGDGFVAIPGFKAITGREVDNTVSVYDVVTKDYHEITHAAFIDAWVRATNNAPIETMGVLYGGATLFTSTKMPTIDVKGDAVDTYLLAFNPLKAGQAATMRVTGVRVVCANTLAASGRDFISECRVIHSRPAVEQLERFIRDTWTMATAKVATLKEAFELLASTRVADDVAKGVLATVYVTVPYPEALLNRASSDRDALRALVEIDRTNAGQQEHRETAYRLFAGDGTGSASDAAKGTAWGLYNAVVEYEQYMKKYRRAESVLVGAGKERIMAAYDATMAVANGH